MVTTLNPILQKLLAVDHGIGLCWLGNLSWLVRSEGKLLAFDLDLDIDSRLAPSPIATEELAPALDILFVTHEHGDHFSGPTSRILSEKSGCRFVLPANCLVSAAKYGIQDSRIITACPGVSMSVGGIHVEPVRALHGHTDFSVYRHANLDDCGYVLSLSGLRIYQPGDTVLLHEHLEDFTDVDVLFISPTLHNTHIEDSLTMIRAIQPSRIFPQHYGTYEPTEKNSYWTVGYPDELRDALPDDLRVGYHKLSQGEVFVVD